MYIVHCIVLYVMYACKYFTLNSKVYALELFVNKMHFRLALLCIADNLPCAICCDKCKKLNIVYLIYSFRREKDRNNYIHDIFNN